MPTLLFARPWRICPSLVTGEGSLEHSKAWPAGGGKRGWRQGSYFSCGGGTSAQPDWRTSSAGQTHETGSDKNSPLRGGNLGQGGREDCLEERSGNAATERDLVRARRAAPDHLKAAGSMSLRTADTIRANTSCARARGWFPHPAPDRRNALSSVT